MGVYKRGDIWWFDYMAGGKQIRESSHSTNKRTAQNLVARRKTEVLEGRLNLPKSNCPKLRQWADHVIASVPHENTRDRYSASARILVKFFGDVKLSDITSERIEEYQQSRLASKKHPATVNRDVAFLFRMLRLARRGRFVVTNPCEQVERLKERRQRRQAKPLTFEEERRLIAVSEPLLRMFVILLVETGLRAKKEALPLTWRDVDLESETPNVLVRQSKTRAGERRVWLTEFCRGELLRWRSFLGHGYSPHVFPAPRDKQKRWSCYQDSWERAAKKVGLSDRRVYDLRATFASRANAASRVSDLTLAQLLGHASTGILPTYAKPIDDNLLSVIRRMDAFRATQVTNSIQ
jgi:integrase